MVAWKKKEYCPVCGSEMISKQGDAYVCSHCGIRFKEPEEASVSLSRKPKYLG